MLHDMGKPENVPDSDSLDKLEKGTELVPTTCPERRPSLIRNCAIPTSRHREFPVKDEAEGSELVLISWEGLDDPENPKTWPSKKKIFNVTIISMMTFLCPLCSVIFVRSRFYIFNRNRLPVSHKLRRIFILHKCFLPFQSQCFYSGSAADRSSSHLSVTPSAENQSILSGLRYSL